MSSSLILSILVGYFLVLIIISRATSKNADNDSFFVGNKKSPWYIVAFGMIGASLSGVTFISVPGSVMKGSFSYMQMVFGYFVGYLIIAYVLMPIYYRLNLTSIYEYLKQRFGFWSYKTGALFFLVSRIIGASIRLLLVASVLQDILLDRWHVPFWVTVVISVGLIWVYTNRGGIKTIIWTDTLQTAFMLAAVGLAIYVIGDALHLSEQGGVLKAVADSTYSKIFFFEDWHSGNYFWKHFLGGIFIAVGMTGLDQDMMQKNLSCKNIKEAQKNMLSFAVVLVVVNYIFLGLGALLYLYHDATGIGSKAISEGKLDHLFSEIALSENTGTFLGILFLLGLIAAAYSSADSALTSLTTSVAVDFMDIEKKAKKKQESLRKRLHIIMSAIIILTVIILRYTTEDSAIWTLIKLAGFTYGPLIGLFFFGILTKRKLHEKLVLPASLFVSIFMGIIWYYSSNDKTSWMHHWIHSWLGDYQFGAELIIYNAVLAFGMLFLISYSGKRNSSDIQFDSE